MKDDTKRFEAYLEGKLNAGELADLEAAIREESEVRRAFADFLHLEGVLRAEAHDLFSDVEEIETEGSLAVASSNRWRASLAAAATLAVGLAAGWSLRQENAEPIAAIEPVEAIATLADIRSCKWGASSLPTEEGARLHPGNLDLLEGLATVTFDSGATVTLEAPAALELESAMRCRLVAGAAVAWVPDGAEGFQIQTDDALVTDYGTRFGVTARGGGKSEVLVLEGEVGVTHRKADAEKRLKTGEMVRFDAEELIEATADVGGETSRNEESSNQSEGWHVITTGEGAGKDSYVRQGNAGAPFGNSPLLMVKNSTEFEGNRRKAYLTFDCASARGRPISQVELVLSIQNSGLGYASVVPDATFAVYGLTDESLDESWAESELRWENAPANRTDHGFQLDSERTVLLGEFVVEQGVSSGLRTLSGPALADFLKADTNGLATFVVVRLTDENDRHGLVHAFASAEHPAAMPPTLRLRFE